MGMIRVVRCTNAERIAYGGIEVGRIFFCTDTSKVWIGTAGGDLGLGASLGDISDVIAPSPADSDVLVWDNDASAWINEPHELVIAEIFDGLNTADINGQGAYRRCDPWVGTEAGTGIAEVVVKAGADKMLRVTTGTPFAANLGTARLDINANSKISSGIFKWKARTSDVTKLFDCFEFRKDGVWKFLISLGDGSQMRLGWGTSSFANIKAIANNTWYEVEVHWNSASQTIAVFVDGTFEILQTLHDNAKCEYINRLFVCGYSDAVTCDIDDLEIVNFGVYPYQI